MDFESTGGDIMSLLTKYLPGASDTLADFIARGNGVSTALANNFTQQNDTGQIVWLQTAWTGIP